MEQNGTERNEQNSCFKSLSFYEEWTSWRFTWWQRMTENDPATCFNFSSMAVYGWGAYVRDKSFCARTLVEKIGGAYMRDTMVNTGKHFSTIALISLRPGAHSPRTEEVGHLRCAHDCALDSIRFRECNCMFYIPTSTATFPCQYGLGLRVNKPTQNT